MIAILKSLFLPIITHTPQTPCVCGEGTELLGIHRGCGWRTPGPPQLKHKLQSDAVGRVGAVPGLRHQCQQGQEVRAGPEALWWGRGTQRWDSPQWQRPRKDQLHCCTGRWWRKWESTTGQLGALSTTMLGCLPPYAAEFMPVNTCASILVCALCNIEMCCVSRATLHLQAGIPSVSC